MIELTARTWLETVTDGREWERVRDEPRLRAAFVTLAKTRESWPAPKHFVDAIPPVPPPLALAKDHRPASQETIRKAGEKVRAMLREVAAPMPDAKPERDTTPEQRERIETELRQHYDRKRAAGGDT